MPGRTVGKRNRIRIIGAVAAAASASLVLAACGSTKDTGGAGNADAARAAGIRVERVMLGVFVVAGVLASVGGIMQTGYVGAISANQGQNMIFTVFAAAVIGGISLDGGKGTMFGALTGVLLLGVVQNLLTLAQVPSFWIQAIYGGIILVALMIARVTTGRAQD
jgi:simple sugar transport system permease protein